MRIVLTDGDNLTVILHKLLIISALVAALIWALFIAPRTVHSQTIVARETATTTLERTFESLVPYLAEKYGQDESLARSIIRCESDTNAKALGKNRLKDGTVWSKDHGYWQINDYYHEADAKRMGFDIYQWEGNLEYGFLLMKRQGTAPWTASQACWSKAKTTL